MIAGPFGQAIRNKAQGILYEFLQFQVKNQQMVKHFVDFCDSMLFIQRYWRLAKTRKVILRQMRDHRKEGRPESLVLMSKLRQYQGVLNIVLALHVTKREKARQAYESKLNVAYIELEQIRKDANIN